MAWAFHAIVKASAGKGFLSNHLRANSKKEKGRCAVAAASDPSCLMPSVRVAIRLRGRVLLATGRKQNRHGKYKDDQWNNEERRGYVHRPISFTLQE
jgi:hypothetical protein